jgi:aminopeptidase
MTDDRVARYADLLVDTCLDVQPGWEVLVFGGSAARPLLEEIARSIARREAYAVFQLGPGGGIGAADRSWTKEAPEELLAKPSALQAHLLEKCDALVNVEAPENTREAASLDPARLAATQAAYRPSLQRLLSHEVPWVGCQFPTPALAQEAGMSTEEFTDFLFDACLLDWAAEGDRMQRIADRFDAAEEVRIVGTGTDLRLSLANRSMEVDAGSGNMPGGEFFGCPVEDSAQGEILFGEFPAVYTGREMTGIRLRFEAGRVVEATSDTNEEFLLHVIDRDEGARRLGELGIGCNPGITRYMKNTLFDEKIDGTVHLALGNGFPNLGGTNESTVHWDIVKDLRPAAGRQQGGRIELDGETVQEDGRWLI